MIGNENGSRSNVLVQWISRDYMIKNKKDVKDIPIGPDEYMVLIREGKIESVDTETQVDPRPGLLRRFVDYVGTRKDVQLLIIDTRKHELAIPFEAYSKDRVLIQGAANLFANVSRDSPELALRLMKEVGQFGSAYNQEGFREFTIEDLTELLKRNVQYIVDTEAIVNMDAAAIRDNRAGICTDIVSALNAKTPYWANYGLAVTYSSVVIDRNEFERLEIKERENALKRRKQELEYAEASGDSEQRIRLQELVNRENAALELNKYLSSVDLQAAKDAHDADVKHEATMRGLQHQEDEKVRQMEIVNRLEMMAIYHQQEIDRINSDKEMDEHEKRVKIAEIDSRVYFINQQVEKAKIDLRNYEEEEKIRLETKRKQSEYDVERQRQEDEHRRKLEQAEALAKLSKPQDELRAKEQDHKHEENLAAIDADVKKTEIVNSGDVLRAKTEAEAAKARYEAYKEALGDAHGREMDHAHMTKETVAASHGNQAEASIFCPSCGASNRPNAKFCCICGVKIRGE